MSNKKCYVVMSQSENYNDEYNYFDEGSNLEEVFMDKDKAEKRASDMNVDWILNQLQNGFEEWEDYAQFFKDQDTIEEDIRKVFGNNARFDEGRIYFQNDSDEEVDVVEFDIEKVTDKQKKDLCKIIRNVPHYVVESNLNP